MHRLFVAAAAVAALTVLAASSAEAQTVNETRPYNSTILNPCNQETVVFSGSIHYHERTQVSNDGRIHFISHHNFSATGYGQRTGLQYNVGGQMNTNSKFPSFPISFRQRNKVVSHGPADNFHATFVFHVNGNGQQTENSTESDCNG